MTKNALILGASGRFGRAAAAAFEQAGWSVRRFHRNQDDLMQAAAGVDVIVNGWNPQYPDWARLLPGLHQEVIAAAEASGATIIVPGNVYVFGAATALPWGESSPHQACNPLGRLRIEMEQAYRASKAQVILLRAGDFLDTEASGNWFDAILTSKLKKGQFCYPGNATISHAWAYLPDLARAAVMLAERRGDLPRYLDVPFAGYDLSGEALLVALNTVLLQPARLKQMSWLPLQLARPFWPMARCLLEMRYLWDTAHRLDGALLQALLPDFQPSDLAQALSHCIPPSLQRRQTARPKSADLSKPELAS